MKKNHILLVILWAVFTSVQGQDKIITWKGDTIECKVLSKGEKTVRFEKREGSLLTVAKMDRLEIKQLIISQNPEVKEKERLPYRKLQLSFKGGPSYLVASTKNAEESAVSSGLTSKEAKSYYRQLKLGSSASADAHWFVEPGMGVGLKYRYFSSGADEWVTLDPKDGVTLYYGPMRETMYVNFVGASLKTMQAFGKSDRLHLISSVSLGMSLYRDEATVLQSNLLLSGKAFGANLDTGIEYAVNHHFSLGLNLGVFSSRLKKIKVDNGTENSTVELPKEQYENVSAFDLSAGIKIYF